NHAVGDGRRRSSFYWQYDSGNEPAFDCAAPAGKTERGAQVISRAASIAPPEGSAKASPRSVRGASGGREDSASARSQTALSRVTSAQCAPPEGRYPCQYGRNFVGGKL